jgi:hypothetical protein
MRNHIELDVGLNKRSNCLIFDNFITVMFMVLKFVKMPLLFLIFFLQATAFYFLEPLIMK